MAEHIRADHTGRTTPDGLHFSALIEHPTPDTQVAVVRLFDIVGIFFVALWAVALIVFVLVGQEDGSGRTISLTEGAIELSEDTVWMTVYRAGEEVGSLREDRTRLIDGWLFEMQGIVLLDLIDDTYAFRFVSRSTLNEDLTLRSAVATVKAFGMTLTMDGQYRESDGDPHFLINLTLEDSTRRFIADLDGRPRLAQHAIPQILATEDLEIGDRFQHEFFDPITLSPSMIQLEYEGTTDVSGYEGTYYGAHSFGQSVGSLHSRIRTDSDGMVLQQILPMQVAVTRMPDAIGQSHFRDFEEIFDETFDNAPPFISAIDADDLLALASRFGSGEVSRLREVGVDDYVADKDEPKETREFYFSRLPDTDRIDLMSPRQHIAFQTADEARVETAIDNPLWHAGDAPPNSSYEPRHEPEDHELLARVADELAHAVETALDDGSVVEPRLFESLRDDICSGLPLDDSPSLEQNTWPSSLSDSPTTAVECLAIFADALAAHEIPPHFVHGAYFDGSDFHRRVWIALFHDGHYLGEFDLLASDATAGSHHLQFYVDDGFDPTLIDDFIDAVSPH